jgi:SAM-dependent MidA family methyltransferase
MTSPLNDIIHDTIRKGGPLKVADYMSLCLTHPQYGYYTTRDPFGAEGDFTTAPEMTQTFGELIGLWCAHMWQQLGSPSPFVLCEAGPGRGTLMKDALRAAAHVPGFIEAAQVYLIETSPLLQKKQAEALADYKVTWIKTPPELPGHPIILLANEFFDALPVRQFVFVKGVWRERCVAVDKNDNLCFVLTETPEAPHYEVPEDTVIEVSPAAVDYANMLARVLVHNRGCGLFIDYGDDEVIGETLQAVRQHRSAHLLTTPGIADITAHVSFEPLRNAVRKIGTKTYGLVELADFLLALGLKQRTEKLLLTANEEQRRSLEAAYHRLTDKSDASSMGRLFKVLAFTDRNCAAPPGF